MTGLLVTAPRAQSIRPTMDVDVVAHAVSVADYHAMERAVDSRGFRHDLSDDAPTRLPNGQVMRLVTAPLFLATKFEAFHGRGRGDFLASHDLEDLITVIDGRAELFDEIKAGDAVLRRYIAAEMADLLSAGDFLDALPGQLPGDVASQARLPQLLRRMRSIAQLN